MNDVPHDLEKRALFLREWKFDWDPELPTDDDDNDEGDESKKAISPCDCNDEAERSELEGDEYGCVG